MVGSPTGLSFLLILVFSTRAARSLADLLCTHAAAWEACRRAYRKTWNFEAGTRKGNRRLSEDYNKFRTEEAILR